MKHHVLKLKLWFEEKKTCNYETRAKLVRGGLSLNLIGVKWRALRQLCANASSSSACEMPNKPSHHSTGNKIGRTKERDERRRTHAKQSTDQRTPTLPKYSKVSSRRLGAPKPSEGLPPNTFKVLSSKWTLRNETPKTSEVPFWKLRPFCSLSGTPD